jgi:DNA-binding Lrp family transcriptional regulator
LAQSADLRDREKTVLEEFARAQGGHIAFQALRRRLGLHPQALTRTLRSLESSGWIRREELGYRLVTQDPNASQLPVPSERVPVFAALVPPHLLPRQIVDQLRHRWFNGLRWFGVSEGPNESVLTWTTEAEGRPVRLRVSSTMIGVELEGRDANNDLANVAPLMQALAVLYGRPRSQPGPLSGPAQ